jgi:hypothetical protein
MTRTKSLQRAIARDDKHGIESRWAYGRAILADPKRMSASGKSLRNGAIEALIAEAGFKADGVTPALSRREIQYRVECARAYETITQLRTAACAIDDWTEFRETGFPSVVVDEVPSPESLLDDIEATDPQEFEQLGLFPPMVKSVPLESASLRVLVSYAEDMRNMTASFARRDEERAAHLRDLCAAVGGDLDVLYPDAVAALANVTT